MSENPSTPGLPAVSVRGTATLEVEPEIARISVTVSGRDRDREKAVGMLSRRSEAVLVTVRAAGAAVDSIETAGLRIQVLYQPGNRRERVEGYLAQITQAVTISGFDVLGDLIPRIGEDEAVDVAGPWWALRLDSDVLRQARVAAVRDALDRANQYASAVGSRVVGLVQLADPGLMADGAGAPGAPGGPPAMAAPMAGAATRSGGEQPTLTIAPAKQTVRAVVEARFTISAPDLGTNPG